MLDENSKQRVKELCDQIAKEQDRDRFSLLISELNHLLELSGARPNATGNDDAGALAIGHKKPS